MPKARKPIILIGGFPEIIELCIDAGYKIAAIIDPVAPLDKKIPYWGDDKAAVKELNKHKKIPLVLSPDGGTVRQKLAEYYRGLGRKFATIIHPEAKISRSAQIDEGALIQYGCVISANVHVQAFARVNVGGVIMHDVVLGKFSTVAPCAVLLGRVRIEEFGYVGGQATILPNLTVGACAIIGAGAVVTKDVPAGLVARGVPARY